MKRKRKKRKQEEEKEKEKEKKEKGKKEKKNNMGPRANFNLVLLPPESDSLVTQVDIGGGGQMAKWATQARTTA